MRFWFSKINAEGPQNPPTSSHHKKIGEKYPVKSANILINHWSITASLPTPIRKNIHFQSPSVDNVICFSVKPQPFLQDTWASYLEIFTSTQVFKLISRKVQLFFANCDTSIQEAISSIMNIHIGKHTIKCLGLPLFSNRLYPADCSPLIEKFKNKLAGWSACTLSYAGRIQLRNSVLL